MAITPEQFKEAFLSAIGQIEEILIKKWGAPREEYTKQISEIFPDITRQLGLKDYCAEYYKIDAVFYSELDTDNFPSKNYAKFIEIAYEHENGVTESIEEIV